MPAVEPGTIDVSRFQAGRRGDDAVTLEPSLLDAKAGPAAVASHVDDSTPMPRRLPRLDPQRGLIRGQGPGRLLEVGPDERLG